MNTTTTTDDRSSFTVEALLKLIKRAPKPFNPFEELAKSHGCDLQQGDYLIIPEHWFDRLPELRTFRSTKGVKIMNDIPTAYSLNSRKITKRAYELFREGAES